MNLEEFKVNSKEENGVLLGQNDMGGAYVHGPFGNTDSQIKIAYLIGMHPLESKSHRALFDTLTSRDDLNYCYYIYNIEVRELIEEGRKDGQLLAQEFVRDEIIDNDYDLFIDIHSNRGLTGFGQYEISNFIFAPGFDDRSGKFVDDLLLKIPEIEFYVPEVRTSPSYITEPTSKAGVPTIVYETYTHEPIETTYSLAEKLVNGVDNLKFK